MTKIWKESAQIIFFGYSRGTLCYVYLFDMITNSSNSRQQQQQKIQPLYITHCTVGVCSVHFYNNVVGPKFFPSISAFRIGILLLPSLSEKSINYRANYVAKVLSAVLAKQKYYMLQQYYKVLLLFSLQTQAQQQLQNNFARSVFLIINLGCPGHMHYPKTEWYINCIVLFWIMI